jgi:glycosyltransferase involved in cell wall biosynthesis
MSVAARVSLIPPSGAMNAASGVALALTGHRTRPSSLRERLGPYSVSLIIPARNEAKGLREVLGEAIPDFIDEVIVVDGHSVDRTPEVVAAVCPRARIIVQPGRGKGDAIKTGLAVAQGDIVVTMDGDGSHRLSDIHPMVDKLLDGYDFVKGSRALPGADSDDFTAWRSAGNWALTAFTRWLFGADWTDITYGFNAYWRQIMLDDARLSSGFQFEIQTAIRASRGGLAVSEIACFERRRVWGTSKLSPVSDGWNILKAILAEAAPRRRVHFRSVVDLYLTASREIP